VALDNDSPFTLASKAGLNKGLGEDLETGARKLVSVPSRYFTFECIVRDDKTVVLHFKNLIPTFRNKRDMDYLAKWMRDRVGAFGSYYADWIGVINRNDGKGKLLINSLDVFISQYTPAMVHDEDFIHRHFSNLAVKLIEDLNCRH
jgi:hypothetical protein